MPDKSFSSDQSTNSDSSQGTNTDEGGSESPKSFEELGISIEDVVALQKRDEHAQTFIETLKEETQSLRTEMTGLKDAFTKGELINKALEGDDLDNDSQTGLSEEELLNKALAHVKAGLQEEKTVEVNKANFKEVTETLTEKYGENVDKHMTKVCEDLGMTWEEAVVLSETKPKVALQLFGAEKKSVQTFSNGTVNTNAFQDTQSDEKVDLMAIRRDKDRVSNFEERLKQQVAALNA